jgi:polyvinyl alcohol dehydrogenase (cytochrome)
MRLCNAAAVTSWLLSTAAFAQDGAALFAKHCASCHHADSPTRAPLPEAMAALSPDAVKAALESGSMKEQGAALTAAERASLAAHLGRGRLTTLGPKGVCAPGSRPRGSSAQWNGWSVDAANTRHQPRAQAGISADDVPRLQLKWAFGIPNVTSAVSQPTVFDGRVLFGSMSGTVYALDASTGCTYWTFQADDAVRSSVSVASLRSRRRAAFFGDTKANVYAIDLETASLIWRVRLDEHPWARVTGAPRLDGSRLYVPISSNEEVPAGNAKYECCTFRGSVAALEVETGKVVWKTHTITTAPEPTRKNSAGTQLHGPSGAPVWSSPALDPETRTLYAATGNGYSNPSADTTDAVIALDMDTGARKWHKQFTANDNWNFACISLSRANCPEESGPDRDIAASPVLRKVNGKKVLLVGDKSGVVHALDPGRQGEVVWETRIGKGSALGGIMWGMAADDRTLYVPLSDVLTVSPGGLFALQLTTGEKLWHVAPREPLCRGKRGCSPAQPAAATLLDGIVFSGAMDGVLRAFQAAGGARVWEYNTLREFDTVNGVKAAGGSLNGSGPVAAGGMLYVHSGYGILGGMTGNVLLAFSVEGR